MPEDLYSLSAKRVWVAGHRGMVGSALVRRLEDENCEVLTAGRDVMDLRDQAAVHAWVGSEKPDAVFLAAATVGGIHANRSRPAEFLYDNLMIEANIIHAAFENAVEKLMFLGSSCIYPKLAPQPMREEELLGGPLEPTNQWYAIAKISGIMLCQAFREQHGCDYISAQPTNLYGIGDNFDLESSHVIPALIAKAHTAKTEGAASMGVWGSGDPKREFLFTDDLADALVYMMKHYSDDTQINVGTGEDLTIRDIAEQVCRTVGFEGELAFDTSMPDGSPRKLLNVDRLTAMGWTAKTSLEDGLRQTYDWYLENYVNG
ncbi:MAG: GDP-L-fucose synthase [Rhodospirillales bacterium]|nr:GDP-L-fucose synthase [Alphaproteobacteria bacterium]MBL6948643.1 GDP-L-fucose synthase [Rhodospirillales bacterium]